MAKDKDKKKKWIILSEKEYTKLDRKDRADYNKWRKSQASFENKQLEALKGFDRHLSNFDQGLKDHLTNMRGSEDALAQFVKSRNDSITKLDATLEKNMRGTLSLVERFAFDTQRAAKEAIVDANLAVKKHDEMQSQTGKDVEEQYMSLVHQLQDASSKEEREMLIRQIAETRKQGEIALAKDEKELARFKDLTGDAAKNIEKLDSGMSVWKGAIADSVLSYEDIASKMLGGGFLGKLAVNLIKRKKQQKQIELATQARIEQGQAVDAQGAGAPQTTQLTVEGQTPSEQAMIKEIETSNKHLEVISGIQGDLFEVAEGDKESKLEAERTAERRHDESLKNTSKLGVVWKKMKGGGSAIWDVIVGLIGGKWIAAAAGFLLTPIKKLVGMVAGGIGKAVSFIMPKKWTEGLSNFFKSTDKAQAGAMTKTKKSGGFLKKIIDGFKQIFKGIGDLIVGIFKTLAKVLKHIGKGIADLLKGVAQGIGHFGKPQVLLGALALVIVAGGIWVFAKAMMEFTKVTWKAVGVAVVSMIALVGALALIGALMMSGIGAVALLAGAAALVIVAGAMWVLGKALQEIGKSIPLFTPLLDKFSELGMVGLKLIGAAAGITAVAAALAVFMAVGAVGGVVSAAAGVVTGILDWFSGKETKSPLQILGGITAFAQEAGNLDKGAKGIYLLVDALEDFSKVKLDNKQIEETIHMISGLAGVLGAFVSGQPSVLAGIGRIFGGPIELAGHMFKKLLGIGTEKTPLEDYTEQFVKFINAIPMQKINEKTEAIKNLANAIGEVSDNLTEIRGGVNIGDVLSRNQDANIILNNLARQAAAQVLPQINTSNTTSFNNSHQSVMMPMTVRNTENSLNDIQDRRW
tara:strand:- start:1203 stop:3788 length:2586 start_codon:yes stop_codon:yes gene_type:complete